MQQNGFHTKYGNDISLRTKYFEPVELRRGYLVKENEALLHKLVKE